MFEILHNPITLPSAGASQDLFNNNPFLILRKETAESIILTKTSITTNTSVPVDQKFLDDNVK